MMRSQIQRAICLAGLAALAVIVSAGAASASTITVFTNFGTSDSFNTVGGYTTTGSDYGNVVTAMPFTAGPTADLADAVLALVNFAGDNSPITLDLESNSGSRVPGSILATLTQQGTIPLTSAGLVTFDYSGTPVELMSDTSYWLVALETDPDSIQAWSRSNSGSDTGTSAYNDSGSATGPWFTNSDQPIAAFQVDGTTPTTAAEPGTFQLLALAILGGLGALWVERRRKLSRCAV